MLKLFIFAMLTSGCAGSIEPSNDDEAGWSQAFGPGPEAAVVDDDIVGVTLHHPRAWEPVRDAHRFATYGFVLRDGDVPVARVAIDEQARPSDLDQIVEAKRADYPDFEMTTTEMQLGGRRAIALGPVPGGQPSTNVYFAVGEHVYRVNYYGEKLDGRARAMLSALRFREPTVSSASLALPDSDALPATAAPAARPVQAPVHLSTSAGFGGYVMNNGCYAQPSDLFIQTTHSWDANGTGWSRMGTPNFWGDNTHGNWGLGRCASNFYTNDLYAIDYYLRVGDRLYSPFKSGYVTYAGWDPENWWNYGRMVVIVTQGGAYASLSAHLSAVNVRAGQYVTDETLIGWAGSTGYAPPYPHVHQAFYYYPSFSYGRPYGGRGMMQTALTHLGDGGGRYLGFFQGKWASW